MVDETHTMRLRVVLDGLQEVEAQANRLRSSLDNTLQFGRSPGAAVAGGAVGKDPIGQTVSQNASAERILGDYSAAARARNSLTIAENNLAKVIERQAAETSAFKGSGDERLAMARDQITARSRAINAVDSASENLAKALLQEEQVARVDAQTQSALNRVVRTAKTDLANAEKEAARRVAEANKATDQGLQRAVARGEAEYLQSLKQADRAFKEQAAQLRDAVKTGRQIAAEELRASQSALSPEEVSRITNPVVREPGDTDRIYKARQQLADKILAAETAGLKFQDTINGALHGEYNSIEESRTKLTQATIGRDTANRSVINAENQLATALRAASVSMAKQDASMRENFAAGFLGRRNGEQSVPLMEQLGQAAKFSVLYGGAYKAMFLITQTLQNTLQEGIAFQNGMTDLSIATGRPKEQLGTLATTLGQAAVAAGAAPSQGIETGARSLGLYGATDSSQAEQDRVATISAQVVSRLAVGSKMDPVDLQSQIAAIAQAYGMGASGQYRIADLDAYMTKKFGIAQGSTLQPVSESATVGIAAGFSPEQITAIAADLQARTGATDSAVGGYMAQIMSRGGEGSLTSVAAAQGINPNQDLATIIDQLSKKYQNASPSEQQAIAASGGRGKVQNAYVALLTDWQEVQKQTKAAMNGAATGQADTQFAEHMKNIGGELTHLSGQLRDFASQLGQSGLLDAFGAGVIAFDKLLGSVNGILRLFNEIPRPLRDLILYAGLAAGAMKVLGGATEVAAAEESASGAAGLFARGRAGASGIFSKIGTTYAEGRDATLAAQAAKASETEAAAAQAATAAETEAGVASEARWARTAAAYEAAKGVMLSADTVRGMESVEMVAADGTVMSNVLRPASLAGGGLIPATGARAGVRGVIGAAPTAVGEAGAVTAETAAAKAAAARAAVAGSAAAIAPAVSGTASVLGLLVNPVTIAIGGLFAIGAVKGSMDRMRQATTDSLAALTNPDFHSSTATPEQLRTQADYLTEQAAKDRSSTGWFTNALTFGQANNGQIDMARTLEAEAKRLRTVADDAEKAARHAASAPASSGLIASMSANDVTNGLQMLQQSGAGAVGTLDALRNVLYHTADAAKAAAGAFSQGRFAETNAGDIATGLIADVKGSRGFYTRDPTGAVGYAQGKGAVGYGEWIPRSDVATNVATALSGPKVQDRLTAGMKTLGINSAADFTKSNISQLAGIVGKGVAEQALAPWAGTPGAEGFMPTLQKEIEKSVAATLRAKTKAAHAAQTGHGALSASDATNYATNIVQANASLLDLTPANDYKTRRTILSNQVKDLNNLNRRGGGNIEAILEALDKSRADLVQNNIDEAEALRKVAVQNDRSRKKALADSRRYILGSINQIVKHGGTSDQLAAVLAAAGPWAVDQARTAIEDALKIAKAAANLESSISSFGDRVLAPFGGMGRPGQDPTSHMTTGQGSKRVNALQQMLDSLATDVSGTRQGELSTNQKLGGTSTSTKDTPEQIAAAHAAANAAATRSTLDDARTAVQVAQANVDAAKKHDAAYWGLVATLNQAKLAYADALKAGPTNAQGESIAQVNAARAQAFATRSGGSIASAHAQIQQANADLSVAKKDTIAWWNGMNSLFAGRDAMVQALQQYQLNRAYLSIDMTNPAQMAAADARNAAKILRQDMARGKAGDVIAQDRVNAEQARANAENTRFQQRLTAMQTADELGRISHSKYMNYLDHEKERLEAVKHRTFQQQQELDQIDQLMKTAASSMAAQWNFGDIKLPTPYQVRRYIEQQAKATVVPGGHNADPGNGPRIHLTIETDHAHVKKIVNDETGRGARVTTTVTRRR